MLCVGVVVMNFFRRQCPPHSRRIAKCQTSIGNLHPLCHKGTGTNHTIPAYNSTI